MRLTAFELGKRPIPLSTAKQNKRGDTYAAIRDYPGRVVAVSTAYNRIVRDPTLSVKDACTIERMPKAPNPTRPVAERHCQAYIADITGDACYKALAKKWGLHHSTINKHRKEHQNAQRQN